MSFIQHIKPIGLKVLLAVVMYERPLYVKRGQAFPLDHISFFFFSTLRVN